MLTGTRRGFIAALAASAFVLLPGLPPAAAAGKFKVVTTFTVIADMARNVAGDPMVDEAAALLLELGDKDFDL